MDVKMIFSMIIISHLVLKVLSVPQMGNYTNINMKTCGVNIYILQTLLQNQSTVKPKIVDGNDVIMGEFPWMASLHYNNNYFCGGSIISGFWILTSSGCLKNKTADKMSVKVGNLRKDYGDKFLVGLIFRHPTDDIALLELQSEIKPYISPEISIFVINGVCLPEKDISNKDEEEAILSGFGSTDIHDNNKNNRMRKENYKINSASECQNVHLICVNYPNKLGCSGDFGSPLIQYSGDRVVIIGVYARFWGNNKDLCDKGVMYFTRVSHYIDWIQRVIDPNSTSIHIESSPLFISTESVSTETSATSYILIACFLIFFIIIAIIIRIIFIETKDENGRKDSPRSGSITPLKYSKSQTGAEPELKTVNTSRSLIEKDVKSVKNK